jgi:AcrR family transcriptional regulator
MEAILEAARARLAAEGAAGLSLREVARDVGLVSSAVYRYVSSRDELLTLLIVEAFDSLGEDVERAEGARTRADLHGRFRAACTAARSWALAHPHQWALVYGTPVSGYEAPESTIEPATRVAAVLARILVDAHRTGRLQPVAVSSVRSVRRGWDRERMAALMPGVPEPAALRGLITWTALYGHIGFELFHQFGPVLADPDRAFVTVVDELAAAAGLPPA